MAHYVSITPAVEHNEAQALKVLGGATAVLGVAAYMIQNPLALDPGYDLMPKIGDPLLFVLAGVCVGTLTAIGVRRTFRA